VCYAIVSSKLGDERITREERKNENRFFFFLSFFFVTRLRPWGFEKMPIESCADATPPPTTGG